MENSYCNVCGMDDNTENKIISLESKLADKDREIEKLKEIFSKFKELYPYLKHSYSCPSAHPNNIFHVCTCDLDILAQQLVDLVDAYAKSYKIKQERKCTKD